MKQKLLYTLELIVFVMVVLATSPAEAQTTLPGTYYPIPSWDQKLPTSTRFIVLSNWDRAAVLDRETGLVWEKSPSAGELHLPWLLALTRALQQLDCGESHGLAVAHVAGVDEPGGPVSVCFPYPSQWSSL